MALKHIEIPDELKRCTNCGAIVIEGGFIIVNQDKKHFYSEQKYCPRCNSSLDLPVLFKTEESASQRADILNHLGQSPGKFRPFGG